MKHITKELANKTIQRPFLLPLVFLSIYGKFSKTILPVSDRNETIEQKKLERNLDWTICGFCIERTCYFPAHLIEKCSRK